MNISISGLGGVPDLQISLKPLTVFVGENGTGKTWTAYTIAAIFGRYGFDKYVEAYLKGETAFRYPSIDTAIHDLMEKGSATLNIVDFAREHAETYINGIAKSAPSWMAGFMGTSRADFGKMDTRIELSEADKQSLDGYLANAEMQLQNFLGVKKDSSELEFNCLKEKGSVQLYFYTKYAKNGPGAILLPVVHKEIREFVVLTIFLIVRKALFRDVVIFPTERTTFITFPFQQEPDEYGKSAKWEAGREPPPLVTWPVSEPVKQLLKTIDSCVRKHSARQEERARDPKLLEIIKLGKLLEDQILLGGISAEQRGNHVELLHNPAENVALELSISSSMVKELTPLVLYLTCLAQPGDLIVIDEPEMNLHPAAQVELTEFLGMLVNAGLRLLITTHSPYIVDHIVNLIRANDLDKEKVANHFYLEQATSFLSKDQVSVYLFDSDSVTDILKEDGDIDWETFSSVSRDLSRIYSNLIG